MSVMMGLRLVQKMGPTCHIPIQEKGAQIQHWGDVKLQAYMYHAPRQKLKLFTYVQRVKSQSC